jgi:hypothetical protein
MNDDWRVQIDAADAGQAILLAEGLEAGESEHQLGDAFHDRVIVSREEERIFLYSGTREQIDAVRVFVAELAAKNGWEIEMELRHWHPVAEEWEDPDAPLPESDAARLAEHRELVAAERREVAAGAPPQWEVRVDLPSHGDAARLEDQLRDEGVPSVRRWKYLVVGAADEDTAREWATRLEGEAPAGSTVTVEGNARAVYDERPPNPFAIFGGLGG